MALSSGTVTSVNAHTAKPEKFQDMTTKNGLSQNTEAGEVSQKWALFPFFFMITKCKKLYKILKYGTKMINSYEDVRKFTNDMKMMKCYGNI